MSNSHQWEAFNKYIDILIEQQRKALEQTDNNIIMYRSQGAITTLRRLKVIKREVFRSKKMTEKIPLTSNYSFRELKRQ